MSDTHLLFVYGSLMSGMGNHRLIERLPKVADYGRPWKVWGYALHDLGAFPGAVVAEQNKSVTGELYTVRNSDIVMLDHFEGVPNLYRRVEVSTGGRRAWMYVFNQQRIKPTIVPNGDWRAYVNSRRQ